MSATPVVFLFALAQARAYLAREGEYEFDEARDGVFRYAEALGVPLYIVEAIIAEEFGPAMFKHAARNDGRLEPDL